MPGLRKCAGLIHRVHVELQLCYQATARVFRDQDHAKTPPPPSPHESDLLANPHLIDILALTQAAERDGLLIPLGMATAGESVAPLPATALDRR